LPPQTSEKLKVQGNKSHGGGPGNLLIWLAPSRPLRGADKWIQGR